MWMTHCDRPLPEAVAETTLTLCFENGSGCLGYTCNLPEDLLLSDLNYQLWATNRPVIHNEEINLKTLNGMGEVSSHQTKFLVMLMRLQKEVAAAGGELVLTLCSSEETEEIKWSSYGDLINQLSDLGFCRDTLWHQAEAIGVCEARIDLSLANIEDANGFYF